MSRSSMVHAAKQTTPSRFELACTAAKLARLIHISARERMADTINHALLQIGRLERHEQGQSAGSGDRSDPSPTIQSNP